MKCDTRVTTENDLTMDKPVGVYNASPRTGGEEVVAVQKIGALHTIAR